MAVAIEKKTGWTYGDYLALTPPDSFNFEILRGELTVAPAPVPRHQWACDELTGSLRFFAKQNDLGRVFSSPIDVILGRHTRAETVVQPDILFIAKDRLDIIAATHISGAPDLMVEVLSVSSAYRDRIEKKRIYAEFGVREYWIVDADQKLLEAFDLTGEVPVLRAAVAGSAVFEPNAFPGLKIPLSELWYPEGEAT